MTPTLVAIFLAALVVALFAARRRRHRLDAAHGRAHSSARDLGVVSSRWLAEIRRDDPWTGR